MVKLGLFAEKVVDDIVFPLLAIGGITLIGYKLYTSGFNKGYKLSHPDDPSKEDVSQMKEVNAEEVN